MAYGRTAPRKRLTMAGIVNELRVSRNNVLVDTAEFAGGKNQGAGRVSLKSVRPNRRDDFNREGVISTAGVSRFNAPA
jgi:hypothetical protein